MISAQPRLVFDCNVFAQALINENSPAGRCYFEAQSGHVSLYVSDYVLAEIVELHLKLPPKYKVTSDDCQALVADIATFAYFIARPEPAFVHPIDPHDSEYVNLAIAANAELIVSRYKHLLGLNDTGKPWSEDFRRQFPLLRVLTPDQFLLEQRRPD